MKRRREHGAGPRFLSVLLVAAACCGFADRAGAQAAGGSERAEQLFKQARELMASRRFEEACPAFEESQRIEPAPGTLLNLADCYEKSGRLASALSAYRVLLPEARRLGQGDREAYASDRIAALERRASRLTLELAPGVELDGLQVELDGKPLDPAGVRSPFPVDGGGHRVRVSRAGFEPWVGHVALAREKDGKTLRVPALRPVAAAPAAAPAFSATASSAAAPEPDAGGLGPAFYAFGAGALVCAAGAGVTGGLALGKANDFEDANGDPSRTPDERRELRDEAQSLALVSTVLTGAAVAAGGVALYLFLARPGTHEASAPSAGLRVTPLVGPHAAGLGLAGSM